MNDRARESKGGNLWVIAFDKETGERIDFVSCPKGQVPAHTMIFEMKGYRVEVFDGDELDKRISQGLR